VTHEPLYRIEAGTPLQRNTRRELAARARRRLGGDPRAHRHRIRQRLALGPTESFERLPFGPGITGYLMPQHVREVTRVGLGLEPVVRREWGLDVEHEALVSILLLHDVDKAILYRWHDDGRTVCTTPSGARMMHGALGAMLLRELGFPELVVETVAAHSFSAPFHHPSTEAWILHYADSLACDRAFIRIGRKPLYQHHLV
jgi:hypothetical protein